MKSETLSDRAEPGASLLPASGRLRLAAGRAHGTRDRDCVMFGLQVSLTPSRRGRGLGRQS
jgi:hypothetical protein